MHANLWLGGPSKASDRRTPESLESALFAPKAEKRTTRRGFTTVEMAISLVVFGLVVVSIFSIAVETAGFLGDHDADIVLQADGNRALDRLTRLLRKSGRVTENETTYPRVLAGGSELQFRVLADLDGNGYPFDEQTSEREWSPQVCTVRRDSQGNLDVYDGAAPVWRLGRFVSSISFETAEESSELGLNEVRVRLVNRRPMARGFDLEYTTTASIQLRN